MHYKSIYYRVRYKRAGQHSKEQDTLHSKHLAEVWRGERGRRKEGGRYGGGERNEPWLQDILTLRKKYTETPVKILILKQIYTETTEPSLEALQAYNPCLHKSACNVILHYLYIYLSIARDIIFMLGNRGE